ncbi:Transcription mediator complex subunit Med12 [Gracilaria domingensis]|nr:Transcription mediator complex subunit Med12 [Gracilaria domingensis]
MDDHIPPWVPEVAPGVHADVYPVEPTRNSDNPHFQYPEELRLDRAAVIYGYSERRLPYEFHSLLPSERPPSLSSSPPQHLTPALTPADLTKLKNGLNALRRARPTKLQRVETPTPHKPSTSRANARAFPLQKHPLSQNLLDDWFNRLSKGSHNPLSDLSHSVPLGPAIVRAAGKVIEMMATRCIPTQRAAWYIRIAVLNECVKQIRPDRPPPSPKLFWTKQLCGLLKTEIDAIRARKTPMLGSMERVAFWKYVLDLARWQADEGLLDVSKWISAIAQALRVELVSSQSFSAPGTKITIMAARRFLPEFLSSPEGARILLEALLRGSGLIISAPRASSAAAREGAKGKNVQRKVTKRGSNAASSLATVTTPAKFTPNACHLEVMHLLQAGLNALQVRVQIKSKEFSMHAFEQLVRKAVDTIQGSKDRRKEREPKPDYRTKEERMGSPNTAMRHFERLSTHGDVARVTASLRQAYKERGGTSTAVRMVCEWALSSMVADRAEAICVATAVLHQLASGLTNAGSASRSTKNGTTPKRYKKGIHQVRNEASPSSLNNLTGNPQLPPLQRDIWHFMKHYANDRIPENMDKNEAIVKELNGGLQTENTNDDDSVVRFIAHLCRHDLLSLPAFVRDVSRLAATNHRGASFLVKCLSLLPDPVDKSVSDCRRSILRKYGYISPTRQYYAHGVCEESVLIACSGDAESVEAQVESLANKGDTNVILSTIDALSHRDLTLITGDDAEVQNKLSTMASFMVSLGEAGTAAEWVIDSLSTLAGSSGVWKEKSMAPRRAILSIAFVRLVSNLSRYIAACGYLESIFTLLKTIWFSPWITPELETQLRRTLSSFARYCGSRIMTSYWTRICVRHLRQFADGGKGLTCVPFALACMRGREKPRQAGSITLADVLNLSDRENLGVPADEDVAELTSRTDLLGYQMSELRARFVSTDGIFPIDDLFGSGFTANDIFGSVVIPVLRNSFLGSENGSSPGSLFSLHSATTLNLICSHRHDVRLQGMRPAILLELVTLLFLGCYYGYTNIDESLEVLFSIEWVWWIFAPYGSVELAKRLRNRVDFYCGRVVIDSKNVVVDKKDLSAALFHMVSSLCRKGTEVNEEMILKAIGTTPFGEVEMLLALLAQHRRDSGAEDDFGLQVSQHATKLRCKHLSRTLVLIALRCCPQEVSSQSVAGCIGHEASRASLGSLTYVLKGLTVEASQYNDFRTISLQWCEIDAARRSLLEACIEHLKPEHAGDAQESLFEQLEQATTILNEAIAERRAPSSILRNGQMISDALESRLLCILRARSVSHHADWWRKRAPLVAELLKAAVGLMTRSAITAACNLLDLCLKSIKEVTTSDDSIHKGVAVSQILEWPANQELKRQLEAALVPAMRWVEQPERDLMVRLMPPSSTYNSSGMNAVRVLKGDGSVVDNWILLEGYGRGVNQESAIPPENMWRQSDTIIDKDSAAGTVHLKRTYSTFASLAV